MGYKADGDNWGSLVEILVMALMMILFGLLMYPVVQSMRFRTTKPGRARRRWPGALEVMARGLEAMCVCSIWRTTASSPSCLHSGGSERPHSEMVPRGRTGAAWCASGAPSMRR
jgi:hypothetical protein